MDSPEPDPILPASSSSSSSACSPPVGQGSPFLAYASGLSPIDQANRGRIDHRFSHTSVPSPLPVFTSPHVDLQRQTGFLERGEVNMSGSKDHGQGDIQSKPDPDPCFQNEDQSCGQSAAFMDRYLTGPLEMDNTVNNGSTVPDNAGDAIVNNNNVRVLPQDQNVENYFNFVESAAYQEGSRFVHNLMELTAPKVDDVDPGMFLDNLSQVQHRQQPVAQVPGDWHNNLNSGCQSFLDPLQRIEAYKFSAGCSSLPSNRLAKDAEQNQRGIRRHLQFEASRACEYNSNETGDTTTLILPAEIRDFKSFVPPHIEGESCAWQADSCSQTEFDVRSDCGSHDALACIPSGLGLHFHSMVGSGSLYSDSSASNKFTGEIYNQLTPFNQQEASAEGKLSTSSDIGMVEELNMVNYGKSRKRGKDGSEGDGCKRCNCKRSKCLKLYCECFASGVYCLDSCSCENCFNKPEYEDTVLDVRQQIEARNPLAFAPKVVKHASNSPAIMEEGSRATPSSARHKRGCNCKKSKCLKKYCECYQAGVGCSDGCRCEGCNNPFGVKLETVYRRAGKWKNSSQGQLDPSETEDACTNSGTASQSSPKWREMIDISHLTPLSHPYAGAIAGSASFSTRDCSQLPLEQTYQGSSLHLPSGYHHWDNSPSGLTPEVHGSNAPPQLSPDSFLQNILEEDDMPEKLTSSSTPTKAVTASSPNKKRVSPPNVQSGQLRSSPSLGLRSGRKLILQAVPSFPSLTPCSKLKHDVHQTDDDHGDSTS
ncbi:hypothetical protein Tsubulata_022833 [Turnera subulata]|uniref:CRC domain-containing protein n=1 Tax=Turnera subulata TaxID=218843 RepID=A0A9Q0JK21_9ROSI|nr:hypothetical protein Tsubulata_022833 [Turnera subulata]